MKEYNDRLEDIFGKLHEKLVAECLRLGDKIPYLAREGKYGQDMRDVNLAWWTNGFWAGMLWQMYKETQNPLYMDTARKTEEALDLALEQFEGLHHDVGFQFLHTAVADYRLTGWKRARVRGLHGANLLAGRYNPAGRYIRAWNKDMAGWMIIDSLMNLHLLYWAGEELGDPRFMEIAKGHTDKALEVLLRPDGSCNHIAVFDPRTGELLENPGGQGFGPGSSWSRGQAWALYGLGLAYVHTKDNRYLDRAKQAAHYFIAQVALTGYVSLADFRAPKEPVYWDTTAAACGACGLLQIAGEVPEGERYFYYDAACRILMALEEKHCCWDKETDGILMDGTAAYGKMEETHVSLIYGDYFFVEGILRLMGKGFLIW